MNANVNDDHYHGLESWVRDYKIVRKFGNVRLAKRLRDDIARQIKKHGLDEARVWGADPESRQ